ncbi:MAG: hypothetical protein EOP48_00950 [Sphingobacteriales bacterium]|nr:MAG: hypothetical protein EOP48_00950 [Sphingobacteriales bacterium]
MESMLQSVLSNVYPGIWDMFECLSRDRFCSISKSPNLEVVKLETERPHHKHNSAVAIEILSDEIKIILQTSFKDDPTQSFFAQKKGVNVEDLFKEYSNLLAGGIREQLSLFGVSTSVGLPWSVTKVVHCEDIETKLPMRSSQSLEIKDAGSSFTTSLCVHYKPELNLSDFQFKKSDESVSKGLELF